MLYIKKNPEVMEDLMEDMSTVTSDDVVGLAQEINMECAMYSFEATHSVLEAYEVSLEMSDGAEQAKRDVEAGNVTDAEVVDKPAADNKVNEKAKKGIFTRIKEALKSLWNKIKEMFQRFVNWITSKIESTDKFLEKFKDKKLGSAKIESHDFAEVFKRVKSVNEQGKKMFDAAKKAMDEILAKGKDAKADKEFIELIHANREEYNEYCDNINKSSFSTLRNMLGDKANFPEVVKVGLLGEKKEREWKGEELIKILQDNKDIRKSLEKLNFSTLDHIKLYNKYADNAELLGSVKGALGIIGFNQFASFVMYASNKSAVMMSQTVLVAQSTIMELRAAINKCADAKTADAK